MKSVLVLQHIGCETLGTIGDALARAGATPRHIRSFAGEPVPKTLGSAAGLIVLGGPQSVYDRERFPFLHDEIRLIEAALQHDRPVLGVCLGSQLLAATLGAPVTRGRQKEIGWFDITLTKAARADALFAGVPRQFTGFHWHGDVFELPAGAVALAASARTPIQAYRYSNHAYGLLFHLEVTGPQIAEMVTLFADELHASHANPRAILAGTNQQLAALQTIGAQVYRAWTKLL